jgi:hypothetical protein
MESHTSEKFWKCFDELPAQIQIKAKALYPRWKDDPWDPVFQFRQIHTTLPIYSIRIGINWRAVGTIKENTPQISKLQVTRKKSSTY